MLRFSQKSGRKPDKRLPQPLLELAPEEAAELSKYGSARQVSDFLEKGAIRGAPGEALPAGIQDALCQRLERSSRRGAIARLLAPLSMPCILAFAERAVRDANPLSQYQTAAVFAGAVVASAILGARLSDSFWRWMSERAAGLIRCGRVTSPQAQDSVSFIIVEAKDSESAFRLLKGDKIPDETTACRLAGEIFSHGSEEQARELADDERIPGRARDLLRLKAPQRGR
ncbi:MAG: hypothetical protein AB1324_01925 [Candidatus Micrarchaeota archaeon]